MNIAFYAPMKPPTSPVPSGDRRMARALMSALEWSGHRVEVASDMVSREPLGDPGRQRRLRAEGEKIAADLVRKVGAGDLETRPHLWFTYHLYYKAPDWIGPAVANGLGIPYVVAEASFAPKRAVGPWAENHRAVEAALRRADLIFGINPANAPCVEPLLCDASRLVPLKPFLDRSISSLPRMCSGSGPTRLLTVAMMREGAKLASYRLLARALDRLPPSGWHLTIAGDGPAEREVRALFDGKDVTFVGRVGEDDLARLHAASDLFVWPAIGEAYGMAILEAQAAGLPVVAGNTGGVSDIVVDGRTGLLVEQGDAKAFGDAVATLIQAPDRRRVLGEAAADKVRAEHGLERAAALIDARLRALVP